MTRYRWVSSTLTVTLGEGGRGCSGVLSELSRPGVWRSWSAGPRVVWWWWCDDVTGPPRYPAAKLYIYTGDTDAAPDMILAKVAELGSSAE